MTWHKDKLKDILVSAGDALGSALPRMDSAGLQVLLVVDENKRLQGIVTDGDVRRALLRGQGLDAEIGVVMHPSPRVLPEGVSLAKARQMMTTYGIRHIPLVDGQGRVRDLMIWADVFDGRPTEKHEQVVIMAGGKGSRLDPFTKILPKPMIPLGDKPIIEVLMDKFHQQGFSRFILSIGYKGEVIKFYFSDSNGRPYHIEFVEEDEPLGTAGALGLVKHSLQGTFIVSNCDVIVEMDYAELLQYHKDKNNAITIVGALRDFTVPYGVLRTEADQLQTIEEKPNFHFLVNTGLYVLEPGVLSILSEAKSSIHMPDLILAAKQEGARIGVYPHHGKWFDIGQWDEYHRTLRVLEGAV